MATAYAGLLGVFGRFGRLLRGPAPGSYADAYHLRPWFVTFLIWVALLAGAAVISFEHYEAGRPWAQRVWLVSIAMFYVSICCVFFPAPTAWIVMLLASNDVALIESVPLRVGVVACLCGFSTGVANLNEYHIITFFLRYRGAARIRQTRFYEVAARWFGVAPFWVIVAAAFLPIPVDVVRWLAITYRYPRRRFFAAYVAGRTPRYAILAASSVWFNLSGWEIAVIQLALVMLAAGKVLVSLLRARTQTLDAGTDGHHAELPADWSNAPSSFPAPASAGRTKPVREGSLPEADGHE